ncbi:YciI family protein [Cellulomonas soli]|uniref:YciI family protein n=1 Tax=Cellulomonas soli TaxID=931535 RepID=UPI003F83E7A6
MLYLISVIDDTTGSATPDEMAAIDTFNDALREQGHWVFAGGLTPPGSSTVIDNRAGRAVLTDGPFVETKEYLAGFWIVEAPDLDVALALASEGSRSCQRRVEVRPFLGGSA